jgi:hypothetical protein
VQTEFGLQPFQNQILQVQTMIKNVRGVCQRCGGPMEFSAAATGTTSTCPLCGQETELVLEVPEVAKSGIGIKATIYGIVALVILAGGFGAVVFALKRAERLKARQGATVITSATPGATDPFAAIGFNVSPVTLEQGTGSAVVYAVGNVKNLTSRQRFGVRVELELLDATGNKVGAAKDYRTLLEPSGDWRFRALVAETKAVAARVASIQEDR